MVIVVFLAFGLLVCQAESQLCGPGGIFPGLGLDNGIFGPGLQIGTAQPNYGLPSCGQSGPPCGIQVPSCGRQLPPCGIQGPPCGKQGPPCVIQGPPCGIQGPPCGITPPCSLQVPSCGIPPPSCGSPCCIQVPPCGGQVPPCGNQMPPCGTQVPPCNVQVPPCGVQLPPCGVQLPPCVQVPASNNFIPNQCGCSTYLPSLPLPSNCDYSQSITVIDNTLANSLANALQLLIVSNLLESTLACSNPSYSVCETNPFCSNVIEILTPDYYPCNQLCEPIYEAIVTPCVEVPCYQESMVSYAPCVEINPCPIFGQDPYQNNFCCLDNCGNSFANGYGCSDGFNSFNSYSCDNLVNPYASCFGMPESCGLAKPFGNGFGCLDSIFSPVAAEVLFPAEIPAQLTCNFGYMPNNVPCVSVNVEALPLDTCCYDGVFC